MKIKSLLLGSAAAVVAVTGVRAADAVVIPEPELVEYVRVCDTYGTGFFYIPGTETCMQIGGYVRYQIDVAERFANGGVISAAAATAANAAAVASTIAPLSGATGGAAAAWGATFTSPGLANGGIGNAGTVAIWGNGNRAIARETGWTGTTSADLNIDVRSETELGTLRGFIGIEMAAGTENVNIDQVFIELGGLHMGYSDNAFDGGIVGEVDSLGGAKVNRVAYTFTSGSFDATLSIDDDNVGIAPGGAAVQPAGLNDFTPNVSANAGYDFGMFDARAFVAFDNVTDEWAVKGRVGVDVSDAGRFELAAYYTSGATYVFTGTGTFGLSGTGVTALNAAVAGTFAPSTAGYATVPLYSEWSVQAGYEHQITEKLALTGTAAYWDNVAHLESIVTPLNISADAWGVGLVLDYEIVENLDMKLSVQHIDADVDLTVAGTRYNDVLDSQTSGFLRFERSF